MPLSLLLTFSPIPACLAPNKVPSEALTYRYSAGEEQRYTFSMWGKRNESEFGARGTVVFRIKAVSESGTATIEGETKDLTITYEKNPAAPIEDKFTFRIDKFGVVSIDRTGQFGIIGLLAPGFELPKSDLEVGNSVAITSSTLLEGKSLAFKLTRESESVFQASAEESVPQDLRGNGWTLNWDASAGRPNRIEIKRVTPDRSSTTVLERA